MFLVCQDCRNYKYFFLLLLYTSIDCGMIVFTMLPSVRHGLEGVKVDLWSSVVAPSESAGQALRLPRLS